jgi:hypothetical protein
MRSTHEATSKMTTAKAIESAPPTTIGVEKLRLSPSSMNTP